MNKNWTKVGLGVYALAAIAGSASAQKASGAENGLIGVKLYDSGAKVVALYGSPDEIQAVSIGGGNTSAGSGFGGPGFGGAGGGGSRGPVGGRPGMGPPSNSGADFNSPFSFGDDVLRQSAPMLPPPGRAGGNSGPGGGSRGPGAGVGPVGPTGPSMPGAGGGASETTQYTRWVYNRAGSKYGFIIDNQGHVVQIEAIGMQNNRVKTRKGLGFGATFAQLIKTYGNPDGYEVGGDSILVKYLVNKKVAFRLTRLAEKKPHVVTGVVVAAGKV